MRSQRLRSRRSLFRRRRLLLKRSRLLIQSQRYQLKRSLLTSSQKRLRRKPQQPTLSPKAKMVSQREAVESAVEAEVREALGAHTAEREVTVVIEEEVAEAEVTGEEETARTTRASLRSRREAMPKSREVEVEEAEA